MKVLLVSTNSLDKNGISTFIINNAKIMATRPRMDIDILAPNDVDSNLKKELQSANVGLFILHDRDLKPLHYFSSLISLLRKNNYDAIHVNGSSTIMAIELAAAFFAGVKIRIAHSHNIVTEHKKLNKILRIPFEVFVNRRIACNNAAGKWLFRNKKFDIIDNGIFLKDYQYNQDNRKEIRKKFKLNKNDILLGNVGKFNYQKNQSFLLDVLKQLPEKYKLMLVGNGPDFKDVLLKANVLNLSDRVIFTGVVNDVQRYLSAMDAFLLPSRFEGQPFVVIEAAANGLPIIVSDHVSEEINITNSFTFLPLEIDTWVEQLKKLKLKDRIYETTINTVALRKNGYDLADNVETLYQLYTDD
jgi:glycosyltransferase involved in cell wall biosynthesis